MYCYLIVSKVFAGGKTHIDIPSFFPKYHSLKHPFNFGGSLKNRGYFQKRRFTELNG